MQQTNQKNSFIQHLVRDYKAYFFVTFCFIIFAYIFYSSWKFQYNILKTDSAKPLE